MFKVHVSILCWTKLFSSIAYVLNSVSYLTSLIYVYLMSTMYILLKKSNKNNIFK